MMRRSRISVRPNVRPGSRAMTSQDGQSSQPIVDSTQAAEKEAAQPVGTETTPAGDKPAEVDRNTETISPDVKDRGQSLQSSGGGDAPVSALQRRKRFSAMPNLAKPRVTLATTRAAARLPKSSHPKRRKEKEKPAPLQFAKSSDLERSSQQEQPLPDPAPVCVQLSQSAKSEVKIPFPLPPGAQSISSDLERIAKARKLRELLRQELRKQRKRKKGKSHICEHSIPQDHNKMTMRDLIYYLPESNPMKLPEKPQEPRVEVESSSRRMKKTTRLSLHQRTSW
ncbi:hypothetical protein AAFF_G00337610 [Aldrovandia affinis]|uniref:Uncharacterized protein n=1 Tax=Aldrovandia affinis TaxID=143900 RepID=A0AAD7SKW2_9TELE|nr:hypothetical protein AAFF_G00337610 [Aldrovandia affinis]